MCLYKQVTKSFQIIQLDGSQQIIKSFTNLGNPEHLLSYLSGMLLTKILKTEFQTFATYGTQFSLPQPFSLDCEGIVSLPSLPSFSAVLIQVVILFCTYRAFLFYNGP